MRRLLLPMICLAVAVNLPVSAWETFGTRQGLSSSSVTTVGQDDDGFLWFATQNGLNRWDGSHMTVWQNNPFSPNSLSNNLVQTMMLEGRQIWLGTYGGLDLFDPTNDRFRNFHHDPARPDSLSNDVVVSIFRDSQHQLWVGTLAGLNRMDETTGTFTVIAGELTIRSMAEDSQGKFWVGTSQGLFQLSADGKSLLAWESLHPGHGIPQGTVMEILPGAGSASLWLAVWGQGLVEVNPVSGFVSAWSLPDNRLFHLSRSPEGRFLAASWGGGLLEADAGTRQVTLWAHDVRDPTSLAHDVVYGSFLDRAGVLWVATNGGGVSRRDSHKSAFTSWPTAGKVTTLFVDSQKRLWAGVYNHGVAQIVPGKGLAGTWTNDIVNAIAEDREGRQWWATNDGLVRFDPKTGQTKRWGLNDGLPDQILTTIRFDTAGDLWLGTYRQGLVHRPLPGKAGTSETWLQGELVNVNVLDQKGRTWIGTNGGVALLLADGSIRKWTHDIDDTHSLAGNSVRDILVDSRDRVWLATNGGLCLWDESTSSFTTFGREFGLDSLTTYALAQDSLGQLWLSTADGLYRFIPDHPRFLRFDQSDGLLSSEFYRGGLRLASGDLTFGALNSVVEFFPDNLVRRGSTVPLTLTGLLVGDQTLAVRDEVTLGWQQNSVGFTFALMEFSSPEHHRYSYRLEGFDRGWVEAGSRHEARYTNLPAGRYTFHVRASLGDDEWIEGGRTVAVTIEEAPWLSWYAWLGYVVFAGLFVLLVGKVYLDRRWKKKVVELESLRAQLLEVNKKLDQLSRLDGLTGIPNRRALDTWLDNEWALASRQKQKIALIMLDIDYFKRYNDNYGHLMGDSCLKQVAGVLSDSLHRTTDFCARYGGEEFVVILHDTELEGGLVVAQRLLEAVDELKIPHEMSAVSPTVSISLGVAVLRPENDTVPADLLHAADQALYRAKSRGRHRVEGASSPTPNS